MRWYYLVYIKSDSESAISNYMQPHAFTYSYCIYHLVCNVIFQEECGIILSFPFSPCRNTLEFPSILNRDLSESSTTVFAAESYSPFSSQPAINRIYDKFSGNTRSNLSWSMPTIPRDCIDASCASNRENYTSLCFLKFNWSFNMQSYAFH